MSPRRPHLRNRKKLKAPKRLEDEYEYVKTSPTRHESPEEVSEESSESSELEEEIYESPKPKTSRSRKQPAYRGKVTEFNPNLPPAAFPTLDHPSYVHNGGTVAVDLELLGLKSQELAGFESVNPDLLGRGPHSEQNDPTENVPIPVPTTPEFTHRNPQFIIQGSKKGQKQAQGNMPSSMHGGPNDNGPQNPIWASNMARMVEAGKMSDQDRFMLEMETSDEEDIATDKRPKLARQGSNPKYPAWDDLTITHKLDLADTIGELYPDLDLAHVMHQLRLNPSQKEELVELLNGRRGRAAREEANQQKLMNQTKEMLLRGEPLPQSKFHQMVEENLYETIQEDHHIQTNLMELKKARAYLGNCGFDPALADSNWDVPSISNVAEPRPAQAPLSSSEAEQSSSSRPALATSFLKAAHLPNLHPGLGQQQQKPQALASQHRPNAAAHAQQSPSAPLSSVPIEAHRAVQPPRNSKGSSEDLRSIHHKGMMGAAQQNKSSSNRSAVHSNNALSSASKNRIKASAAASPHVPLKDPQEESSRAVPDRSYALAYKGALPIAHGDQHQQSNTESNAGVSAPKDRLDSIGDRGLANKKRRKKGAS